MSTPFGEKLRRTFGRHGVNKLKAEQFLNMLRGTGFAITAHEGAKLVNYLGTDSEGFLDMENLCSWFDRGESDSRSRDSPALSLSAASETVRGRCVAASARIADVACKEEADDVELEIDPHCLYESGVAKDGVNAGGDEPDDTGGDESDNIVYTSPDAAGGGGRNLDGAYDVNSVDGTAKVDGTHEHGDVAYIHEVAGLDRVVREHADGIERLRRVRVPHVRFSEKVYVSSGSVRLLGSGSADKYTLNATRRIARNEH
eukprot:TRINITY_DN59402_c0_g1_i1.p1 TRINITY_DN59402_c0_g1~~TRINITY_DN59402_c0_g1_i1.p1  ORF type:complete len:258 (-),score=43.99 TRINITY_DN59402_c0_g1_i1:155-928(-)